MTEPIVLPPGVAVAILAFLLSLLPAGLFLWLWYLRRHERPVSVGQVITGFVAGAVLVAPAFFLERWAPQVWAAISPSTVHYFDGAIFPLQTVGDILLPAVGTFLIVALVEEGLRYLVLAGWFRLGKRVDQVFDGLLVGLAMGLGFATVENTLYFFELFSRGSFNTLVFVFFLRFMVSTLAHISFGGIMGALLARGLFSIYRPRLLYVQAFMVPWFLHGLYDWLLGVNQTFYAVLVLFMPIVLLVVWSNRREFFVVNRDDGKLLVAQRPPDDTANRLGEASFRQLKTPWNDNAPWLGVRRAERGTLDGEDSV